MTEGLVEKGLDVTLFATADSITAGKLVRTAKAGYAEDSTLDPKVEECLHISALMERADEFDIIHNHFDFLPLTYSGLIDTPIVTTIHGFSSPRIIPVYQKYNTENNHYVSISNSDRAEELVYAATVYNGIDTALFHYHDTPSDYLLFFGRLHPDKGAHHAIEIAKQTDKKLIIAGLIQDEAYFKQEVEPHIDDEQITYVGNADPEKRDKLLGEAALLLHPIEFDEPFGLSVAESMLCGTPVLAFNRGSMPELIDDGQTGFLVKDVSEAVAAISKTNTISRRKCAESAQERFSKERMVNDYIKVYEQVLAGKKIVENR